MLDFTPYGGGPGRVTTGQRAQRKGLTWEGRPFTWAAHLGCSPGLWFSSSSPKPTTAWCFGEVGLGATPSERPSLKPPAQGSLPSSHACPSVSLRVLLTHTWHLPLPVSSLCLLHGDRRHHCLFLIVWGLQKYCEHMNYWISTSNVQIRGLRGR